MKISQRMNLVKHKARVLFGADKKLADLRKFIGKRVTIPAKDDKPAYTVEIRTIMPNKWKPAFYQINETHMIGMLRFYAQMHNDKSIPEQDFLDFEAMEFEVETPKAKEGLIT